MLTILVNLNVFSKSDFPKSHSFIPLLIIYDKNNNNLYILPSYQFKDERINY